MSFTKLTSHTLYAFAFVAILSVGCKKSNSSGNSSAAISASMGATSFNAGATSTVAWYSTDSAEYIISGFGVNGQDTTGVTIMAFTPFTLNQVITDQSAVNIDYYVSSTKDYFGGYGIGHIALTFTDTTNHKVSGTFTGTLYNTFNGSDSLMVTNGKFNTSFFDQP